MDLCIVTKEYRFLFIHNSNFQKDLCKDKQEYINSCGNAHNTDDALEYVANNVANNVQNHQMNQIIRYQELFPPTMDLQYREAPSDTDTTFTAQTKPDSEIIFRPLNVGQI